MDRFGFQSTEEALHRRVVETISPPAYGHGHAVQFEQLLVVATGALDAPVRMMDQSFLGPPVPDGHLERIFTKGALQPSRHGPSCDFHRAEILHGGQLEPGLICWYVRDIR